MAQTAETLQTKAMTDRLDDLQSYWRAANYLGAAQLYLRSNVLLERKLTADDIKARLLGHWGTVPGLTFVYAHLNRLIQDTASSVLLVVGPGHGAPAILATMWLEGTLAEYYPELSRDRSGLTRLLQSFSWPEGLPSHLAASTPGTIHEGGELGYSLSHAFGAALDNPDLIVACVMGDGEAETGPIAASWHSNKFLNPATDGAVLPILDVNGYKLSGPTIFARMTDEELTSLFEGYGYSVHIVNCYTAPNPHAAMWQTMDQAYAEIRSLQARARGGERLERPKWPMMVLRSPKGWTGPKELDGQAIEDTFHSHQVPIANPKTNPGHLRELEKWLRSYKPEELFGENGSPAQAVIRACPPDELRIGMNPHANGGGVLEPLILPDFRDYDVEVSEPGATQAEATKVLGEFLRDVFVQNETNRNFRIVCPDETTSNRLTSVFETTARVWQWPTVDTDEYLSRSGRVMEILSEHLCEGWLEGYLLTGRHGLFPCYEAFITIVDSMVNQYAKWLKVSRETPWRKPIASLNYLLTSHAWRQDHNGYSHQGPGFINTLLTKKSSVVRIYLPPDANCLLSVMDHCLGTRDYVNLVIASKQPTLQWLDMKAACEHCARGASVWQWASNDEGRPDVILAAAGDVPTLEVIAAAWYLRQEIPNLRVRVVNIVDLLTLESHRDHPHGLDEQAFADIFMEDAPVVFGFHGYPKVIHELIHHRPNPERFHVRGYQEEGTTTTPFDMVVVNGMSRFHLAAEALRRVPRLRSQAGAVIDMFNEKLALHKSYIRENGEDMQEVNEWRWSEG